MAVTITIDSQKVPQIIRANLFLKLYLLIYECRSVVLIGMYAFTYSGLLDVTVPSSVTFIGQVIRTLKIIIFK